MRLILSPPRRPILCPRMVPDHRTSQVGPAADQASGPTAEPVDSEPDGEGVGVSGEPVTAEPDDGSSRHLTRHSCGQSQLQLETRSRAFLVSASLVKAAPPPRVLFFPPSQGGYHIAREPSSLPILPFHKGETTPETTLSVDGSLIACAVPKGAASWAPGGTGSIEVSGGRRLSEAKSSQFRLSTFVFGWLVRSRFLQRTNIMGVSSETRTRPRLRGRLPHTSILSQTQVVPPAPVERGRGRCGL